MNETTFTKQEKYESKSGIKISKLKQETIDSIMSKLGPYKELTIEECQKMTAKKLGKNGLTSALMEMRNEER